MTDPQPVEIVTLVKIASMMALSGAITRIVWSWMDTNAILRVIGHLSASFFSAAIVGFLTWEWIGTHRPGLYGVVCGLAAWLGGDLVDQFGRLLQRRLLRILGKVLPEDLA